MRRISVAKVEQVPFFEPWVGEDYKRRRDAWIAGEGSHCEGMWHIMGESHYGAPEDYRPSLTREVMEEFGLGGYRFFNTVLSVALDRPIAELNPPTDWESFAFSNFVQELISMDPTGMNAGRRPEDSEWQRARACFFGQLLKTKPKQLLIVGKAQWDNAPSEGFTEIEPFEVNPEWGLVDGVGLYAYEADGHTGFTVATWIYHPSSRGYLDVEVARKKIRSIDIATCNLLSSIAQDGEGYYLDGL